MANIVLDGIQLPGDLVFEDEFQWTPVARSAEYTLTGSLVIEESLKLAGRPITLVAKSEFLGHIWLSRATIKALYEKASEVGKVMNLTLSDGRTFSVRFKENGVTADPVYHIGDHADTDRYYLKIQLLVN